MSLIYIYNIYISKKIVINRKLILINIKIKTAILTKMLKKILKFNIK